MHTLREICFFPPLSQMDWTIQQKLPLYGATELAKLFFQNSSTWHSETAAMLTSLGIAEWIVSLPLFKEPLVEEKDGVD